ncbi:hypothetical protein LO772_27150 [Yinghuangia sp. ASG 101]|uniref:dTMP kinase n=1 Tax=Yinghuangia sp. ASG 101 TaxID=2896848 RepID=UPI001E5A4AF7|nr:hypothetical protein [Yinghuangia sp. ASG 101]UGQ10492.1 hypothetical protein LO772_27150 [Yinghuangia sp. ASG 101]
MLISFEGLPGTGKTTQTALLLKALRADAVQATHLPDLRTVDTDPLGSALLELFTSSNDPFLRHGDVLTDTYLAAAVRTHMDAALLAPALAANNVVVEDRGIHTMHSYSLATLLRDHRAEPRSAVQWLRTVGAFAGRTADHALLLKLPVDEAVRRASHRDRRPYTGEEHAFLHHVDQAYDELAARDARLLPVDLTGLDAEEGHQAVVNALSSRHAWPIAQTGDSAASANVS